MSNTTLSTKFDVIDPNDFNEKPVICPSRVSPVVFVFAVFPEPHGAPRMMGIHVMNVQHIMKCLKR